MTATADILLLEDDAGIRESLAECLALEGHTVRAAAEGADALAWLAAGNRPLVALVDLVMPRMNGEEFVAAVRAQPALRDLPIVLMTAVAPGKAPLPVVDALLVKPFELDEFLRVVGRYLR